MQLPVRRGEGEWRGERGLIADSGIMVRELIDGEAESEFGTCRLWDAPALVGEWSRLPRDEEASGRRARSSHPK
jgi:hypothetical protein